MASRTARYQKEIAETLEKVAKGHAAATVSAHTPSVSQSKAGRITGGQTVSDPTGQAAGRLMDLLEAVEDDMREMRDKARKLEDRLAEFLPGPEWDNGIRRCSEDGCARKHYATGLCEAHYRRWKRQEERRAEVLS